MEYCELVYVDKVIAGKLVPLLVQDWYFECWVGCYCDLHNGLTTIGELT